MTLVTALIVGWIAASAAAAVVLGGVLHLREHAVHRGDAPARPARVVAKVPARVAARARPPRSGAHAA